MMIEQRVTFQVVKRQATKTGTCYCGRKRKRSKTFEATINPFNKNPDGTIKDYAQIYKGFDPEIEAWMRETITCSECHIPI